MERTDLPLLLSSELSHAEDGRFPLDRIRMQKAIFLLTQRGAPEWQELYSYRPYNWGPYSGQLVEDVDTLSRSGLISSRPFAGSRYGSYTATATGERRAQEVWKGLSATQRQFLSAVHAYVTAKGFNSLLREVYAAYPEYATESQFRG